MSKQYMLISVSNKGIHTKVEDAFQRKVQYHINDGWELQGGVSVTSLFHGEQFGSTLVYAQALAKGDSK